jgi:hypothetical protein
MNPGRRFTYRKGAAVLHWCFCQCFVRYTPILAFYISIKLIFSIIRCSRMLPKRMSPLFRFPPSVLARCRLQFNLF